MNRCVLHPLSEQSFLGHPELSLLSFQVLTRSAHSPYPLKPSGGWLEVRRVPLLLCLLLVPIDCLGDLQHWDPRPEGAEPFLHRKGRADNWQTCGARIFPVLSALTPLSRVRVETFALKHIALSNRATGPNWGQQCPLSFCVLKDVLETTVPGLRAPRFGLLGALGPHILALELYVFVESRKLLVIRHTQASQSLVPLLQRPLSALLRNPAISKRVLST
mmetsp:Transcript_34131/g.53225  ORF Transcript_34131/g.53225 Transcript_34131/m.53225 type:complete len:219 (-) Transcript_34131:222-878(-)|eukprot:CAMPEP_0184309400 /NCGR_PEP_ID=MMETSP1049-20130417/17570_1 /TAXON_ID=77928 /ORGANISM="Proteomonas sulcata, Strain CCMP704" /LENGTH=218 /DNA_ID=CAMNT_0026622277 /DNA_START=423 /DNA_END=1079 /DNA_ORIENTATION=+